MRYRNHEEADVERKKADSNNSWGGHRNREEVDVGKGGRETRILLKLYSPRPKEG